MDSVRSLVCSPISLPFYCSKADGLTAPDFCRRWWMKCRTAVPDTARSQLLASRELVLLQDQNGGVLSSAWVMQNKYCYSKWMTLLFALYPNQIKKPHQRERKCFKSRSKLGTKKGLFNHLHVLNGEKTESKSLTVADVFKTYPEHGFLLLFVFFFSPMFVCDCTVIGVTGFPGHYPAKWSLYLRCGLGSCPGEFMS